MDVKFVDPHRIGEQLRAAGGGPLPADYEQHTVIAQIAAATFGNDSILFFVVQATTAAVLLLAANTAFNGFPLLGSILARDSYAPKSLSTRGDRLIYSNGVIILALVAAALLIVYRANVTSLIQLYIIGVFVSFTLGQTGMVKHWVTLLRRDRDGLDADGAPRSPDAPPLHRGQVYRSLSINLTGALFTFLVLVVVTITKFTHGAWLVFVIMPILFVLMLGVNRYYRDVSHEIEADAETRFGATGDHAIVLVNKLQKPVLKALDYAIAAKHASFEAVHVAIDEADAANLRAQWAEFGIDAPLTIVSSPYRDISMPLIKYIKAHRLDHGAEVVTVYTPVFVVGHWWEGLLHNHRGRRIRKKLLLVHGVTVALVPWLLDSSELLYGRRSRPFPGQDRRGEPVRPPMRRTGPEVQEDRLLRSAQRNSLQPRRATRPAGPADGVDPALCTGSVPVLVPAAGPTRTPSTPPSSPPSRG
jgi:hypothetical protein